MRLAQKNLPEPKIDINNKNNIRLLKTTDIPTTGIPQPLDITVYE